ncbi:MAG: TetR/AcrR family transcriptional regulator [Prevotella sp.]
MHKNTFSTTLYRQNLHETILKTATSEFMRKGIKAVKMDDIATMLSISKRTLYEIFSNKEELLLESVKLCEKEFSDHMAEFEKNPDNNVIDIVIEFYITQIQWLSNINFLYFSDIRKYKKMREYLDTREEERKKSKLWFFHRGVKEGLFRSDIDYDILSRIGNAAMEHIMRSQMYEEYDMKLIFNNIIFLFVRGICTERGISQFDYKIRDKFGGIH